MGILGPGRAALTSRSGFENRWGGFERRVII
jgi:hypothetical protein